MKELLRFARRYMVPYTLWYVVGTLALIGTNFLSVTIPLYIADGVDALGSSAQGSTTVAHSAMMVAVMGLAIILVRTLSRVAYFTPGRLVEAEVKRDLFEATLRHQPAFMQQWATGDLFSRVSSDVNMLRLLSGFGVLTAANAVIALTMAGGQMVRLSPELAAWLMGPIVVALVVVQLFIRWMFVLMRRLQQQLAALSDHILASYKGVASVQGFAAEEAFQTRFATRNEAYLHTMLQRAQIRAGLGPTLSLAASIDVFVLLYIGGPMVIAGELTVGELVAFTTLIGLIMLPLRASSFLLSVIKQAQAALERVDMILYPAPDRPDLPNPTPPPVTAPALEVRNLSFAYPGSNEPALRDVSFSLPAGGTLGVLGLTGSGKSTLLRLLSRLYNPPPETVFVEGHDIRSLDLDAWRDVMTFVPQRAFLFGDSVADNILLGRDDATTLQSVLELTALTPDIAALPEGTATLVGESGVRLSGGQKQRTALARGLARQHGLLLLDDVLSAVDHATEATLIDSLQSSGKHQVTTVIVAHRVSALLHADLVLVLDSGQVSDLGSPQELMERPGLFRDTWVQQARVDA